MRDSLDIRALPKAEVHLHLEGAIPPEALLRLVHKYGGDEGISDLPSLRKRLRFRDFPQFLATWVWMTQWLREPADFELLATSVARSLADQGVRYAETFFSPLDFERHGTPPAEIARALRRGLDRVPDGPRVALICDLNRHLGPEEGVRVISLIGEVAAEVGVIAIGLGGPEQLVPPEPFAPAYRLATELGLRRVAHAGEAAGPESVRGALDALGAERIGHGVRSVEDPTLVARLAASGIPLEVCPWSNVRTAVVASPGAHPLRTLFDAGVCVALASDDPTFFQTDLVQEYAFARDVHAFTDAELVELARNSFRASFLPEPERALYLAELEAFA